MADIDEVVRRNPKAAATLASMQETLETLSRLRAAGVAKGDQMRPLGRHHTALDLKPNRRIVAGRKISK